METKKEQLKIDFSTLVIVFVLIAFMLVGGIYHIVTKNNEKNHVENSVIENNTNIVSNFV